MLVLFIKQNVNFICHLKYYLYFCFVIEKKNSMCTVNKTVKWKVYMSCLLLNSET